MKEKLWSKNRGDTINYDCISPKIANRFLEKQIELFGNGCGSVKRRVSAWALNCEEDDSPDFISLSEKNRLGTNDIVENITNKCIYSGCMKPERLIEFLGANQEDHLASKTLEGYTDGGSHSFAKCFLELDKHYQVRREKSGGGGTQQWVRTQLEKKYISLAPVRARTLTLIIPSRNRRFESIIEAQDAWYDGKAMIKDFVYMDIETA